MMDLPQNVTEPSLLITSLITRHTKATTIPFVASNIIENASKFDVHPNVTDYTPYNSRPETYIVPFIFGIIFIVGAIGNGTLVVIFMRHRAMRNIPNTYILSLALADLLVILITVPLTSIVYTVDSWPWGGLLCTVSEFIKDVSIGVSVFTLTALSCDRFFAIVDPLRKFHAHGSLTRSTRSTIATAIAIWVLAIVCGMPAVLGSNLKQFHVNENKSFLACYPFPDEWGPEYAKSIVLIRFLIYYAIPLIVIAIFYMMIARHLVYAANFPGEMHGAARQVKARRKVAVTVLAFVVIFGICFLPSHMFMMWFYYDSNSDSHYNIFWHIFRIVGFCLSFANSCANPVALYWVSGTFKKHFQRYLLCQTPKGAIRHNLDFPLGRRDTCLTSTYSSRFQSRRIQNSVPRVQETCVITLSPNGMNCNNEPNYALQILN